MRDRDDIRTAREIVAKWLARGDNYPANLVDNIAAALRREREAAEAAAFVEAQRAP